MHVRVCSVCARADGRGIGRTQPWTQKPIKQLILDGDGSCKEREGEYEGESEYERGNSELSHMNSATEQTVCVSV